MEMNKAPNELKRKRTEESPPKDIKVKSEKLECESMTMQENNDSEDIYNRALMSSDSELIQNENLGGLVQNAVSDLFRFDQLQMDRDSLILWEVRKIVDEAKTEICQKIDEVMDEVRSIKQHFGLSPLKRFKKIGSIETFNSFIEMMKVEQNKEGIIQELKFLPDTTNSKNSNHGKIATIIEYLFTAKFIVEHLKWGEMNGQVKSTESTIYLASYPIFLELGTALLVNATPKEIRTSFQMYFKHRAKKLTVE